MQNINSVAIIGAGAAGCFCAIELKRRYPSYRVVVFEAAPKPMMKLALTGGGRCNLTNSFEAVEKLCEVYPRGDKLLKRLFYRFNNQSIIDWFETEGVRLYTQKDGRVFPQSDDAMQIVRTLERLMKQSGIELRCNSKIAKIAATTNNKFANQASDEIIAVQTNEKFATEQTRSEAPDSSLRGAIATKQSQYKLILQNNDSYYADYVILTSGGTKQNALTTLLPEGIKTSPTVPSLFTFKIPVPELRALMGTTVSNVELSLTGTSFHSAGTLLVTDWGISGPATLKLSSYAATYLASTQYTAELRLNWLAQTEAETREQLNSLIQIGRNKLVSSLKPQNFTDRLWKFLLQRVEVRENARWSELGNKTINRLVSTLTSDIYPIKGRAAFKEEFVTCGGVALSEINPNTLESKLYPGLFFAGEVLDIDAVTGGFNLQAAWTTAFVAAALAAK